MPSGSERRGTEGRPIVITGGANGIGAAIADALLAADSGPCALVDLERGQIGNLESRYGDRVRLFEADVSDPTSVRETAAAIEDWSGPVGGLVNSAGIGHQLMPSIDLDLESWHRVLAVNLDGTFLWCQAAARSMREAGGGTIVNISSVSSQFGWPGRIGYSTSKAAINGLTRCLSVEWAPDNIRVNALLPGYVRTEKVMKWAFESGRVDLAETEQQHAMDRLGEPMEIASAAAFLLSDASSFMTGQTMFVDGGFSVRKGPEFDLHDRS